MRREPGLVVVTLDRPERLNAITYEMYAGLLALCEQVAADPSVRVVVLRGAGGRAFSAGTDIHEFDRIRTGADGVRYEAMIDRVLRSLHGLRAVTIAAIEGVCVGGGLALASHCDIRVCTSDSRFGYPIARTLGNLLAAHVVYRCVSVFGEPLVRQMLLLSDLVDADRAYAVGAIAHVRAPGRLDALVDSIVTGLLTSAPGTLVASKEQLLHLSDRSEAPPKDDAARIARIYGSSDFLSAVRAFGRKEKVSFSTDLW